MPLSEQVKALRRADRKGQMILRKRGGFHSRKGYTRKTKHKVLDPDQ